MDAERRREREAHAIAAIDQAVADLQRVVETLRRNAEAEALREAARGGPREIGAAEVRAIVAARKLRTHYLRLPGGDPAWALLLELYLARLEGRRLSISATVEHAGLRSTTGLRWVRLLEQHGLIARRPCPGNERTVLLDLTDDAADAMRAYLAAALQISPWIL